MVCHQGRIAPPRPKLLRLTNGEAVAGVSNFTYLGGFIPGDSSDIGVRLHMGWTAVRSSVRLWKSTTLTAKSKMTFFKALCQNVFLYGSESWVMTDRAAVKLCGAYTRMLRFAKNLDWSSHPTIAMIYEDSPSVIALITERRLNLLGCTIRQRSTHPQPVLAVLESLVGLYRPGLLGTGSTGFDYIEQLYNDLDQGQRAMDRPTFQRNNWKAITTLADNVSDWKAMVWAAVAAIKPPAPLLEPSIIRKRKRRAAARKEANHQSHEGRSPIRRQRNKPREPSQGLVLTPFGERVKDRQRRHSGNSARSLSEDLN